MKHPSFPDPDRHKHLRDTYESKLFIVMLIALFIVDAILWLGVLAIDLGWIWKGWITP